MRFSPCGNYLLTGARKYNDIFCWDLRHLKQKLPQFFESQMIESNIHDIQYDGNVRVYKYFPPKQNENKCEQRKNSVICKYEREVLHNQRIQFDIHSSGLWMVSGSHNGYCNVYDVNEEHAKIEIEHECRAVSSAQLCPTQEFLATTTGERIYYSKLKVENKKENEVMNTNSDESDSDSDSDDGLSYSQSNVNQILIWDLRNANKGTLPDMI